MLVFDIKLELIEKNPTKQEFTKKNIIKEKKKQAIMSSQTLSL